MVAPPLQKKSDIPKNRDVFQACFFGKQAAFPRSYETHPSWGSGLVVVVQPLLNFWRRTRQLLLLRNPGISMQQLWRSPTNWREFFQYLKQFGKVTSYFEHTQSMNSSSCNDCKWMYNMQTRCMMMRHWAMELHWKSLIETMHSSENTLVHLAKRSLLSRVSAWMCHNQALLRSNHPSPWLGVPFGFERDYAGDKVTHYNPCSMHIHNQPKTPAKEIHSRK